ncbi:hypothetical protein BDP27DRAFT_1421604 [Rhodocollybia butyracea]|uniref:F-box domain-containing protein n=1 Tax=Rhodocollybia butyracea TaxID=206335 RepID=A0A9P5U7H0_9AGAR|nr:hypothetical protein BDP27DRAFT_1421604 [Rhodocollybia butyracea]
MSEVNVPPHSPLDSRSSASLHSPTCSLFESAYQILSTEFLAKSRHNNIPDSPAARDRLRVLITQTRSDLGTCLESTSRSQISRVLELQESLLAPIRTLPSDILIDIFQLVIETSSEPGITYSWKTWRSTKLSGRIYPLTWICFRWRDESLSHSAFWSGITFNYGLDVQPSPEVSAFLCECILRSGDSVPMNIYLSSRGYGSAPAVVAMLVARAHRWREASLFFVSPQQFHSMFPFKPSSTRFPLLENLSVQCDDYWIDPVPNPILECHPPLQKLCLWSLSESYIDLIAGQNLKVLTLHRYYGVSLARLLLMFTRLESLTLESFYFRGNPDAQQIPCQSSLLNLEIGSIDNGPGPVLRSPS